MGNKNTTDLESAAGVFQSVVTGLMQPVRDGRVSFEAVRRLGTPAGATTIARMTAVMEEDAQAEGGQQALSAPCGKYETIIVPNLSAPQLIAELVRKIPLSCLDGYYRAWDFVLDERGRTYEVACWEPKQGYISDEAMLGHFLALDPERPFGGSVAAFVAWIMNKHPAGWNVTVPADPRLACVSHGTVLATPYFFRCNWVPGEKGGCLGMMERPNNNDVSYRFVAFRPVGSARQ